MADAAATFFKNQLNLSELQVRATQLSLLEHLKNLDLVALRADRELQLKVLEGLEGLKDLKDVRILDPISLELSSQVPADFKAELGGTLVIGILNARIRRMLGYMRAPKYALVLDAGSSGTRAIGFKYELWRPATGKRGRTPPKIEELFKEDQEPNAGGITTCAVAHGVAGAAVLRTNAVRNYLKPILARAKARFGDTVGDSKDIRLFILATAGMRDLKSKRPAEFDHLETAIHEFLKNPYLDGGNVDNQKFDTTERADADEIYKTISGEEEAAHGWIASNFSLGTLSELGQLSTKKLGYLEMGGASAQIAFKPFDNELAPEHLENGDITRVTMGGKTLDLFLKTYHLGADKAWEEYEKDLLKEATDAAHNGIISVNAAYNAVITANDNVVPDVHAVIPAATAETAATTVGDAVGNAVDNRVEDPDSPQGREWQSGTKFFKGTGKFNLPRFHKKVDSVLDRLGSPQNPGGSRLLNSHLIKSLKARSFVGGANFYYSTRLVFGKDLNGNPKQGMFSFEEYVREVQRTTMLSWNDLKLRMRARPDKEKYMEKAWFVAEWVQCVLDEGFGFTFHDGEGRTENDLSFRPYNGPEGAELTWTLGKMVLLASSGTVTPPAKIDIITKYHDERLAKQMRDKAVYWEEMVWDYLFMIKSLPGTTNPIVVQRKNALIVLAKHAAETSWKLKWAAHQKEAAARLLKIGEADIVPPEAGLQAVGPAPAAWDAVWNGNQLNALGETTLNALNVANNVTYQSAVRVIKGACGDREA